ncbi:cupin domain-containing protein [Candidatus Thalassolituus haligoni]|uniref:cupin domain-containing protein n=1 Tax=Candidatus Thalassolituus haligoni TaxID=3100113 RepID=UPI003515A72C|tara:strand:- start:12125 stop:13186 length:1062 start_codon:yes stop_codon:yes gene_type:complete
MASFDSLTNADKQNFYQELDPVSLAPLWEVMKGLVPFEPTNKAVPYAWHYEQMRPLLMKSGELLTAAEAERRVLVFENPSFRGQSIVNSTLYAGIQLILPGETAPAHKHTAGALRFVLESEGGYTSVNGERTTMHRGDLVLTPSGTFHDHGHDGEGPVIWIDGLDVPIVNYFQCGFSAQLDTERQLITKVEGYSGAAFGSGMTPFEPRSPFGSTSPIFSYPYSRARAALLAITESEKPDPHWGYVLKYANPLTGDWIMPTMAAWLAYIPDQMITQKYRTTDNQVLVVSEGTVQVDIGDETFELGQNDVMALPGWTWRQFHASEDSVLFFFSDRSAQEKLGIWQEQKGGAETQL